MFEYKDISFFNEYFSSLPDFKLSQKFIKGETEDKKNVYVGKMEAIGTFHPMSIQIEIPTTFPHSKMLFWTASLCGYPHLIKSLNRKDSWFCLNTPFAETAEEQLDQEILRLRDWIKRYVREDLPTTIKDLDVYRALYMLNSYSWENIDEMNEYKQEASLTFVGDFSSKAKDFKDKKGKFHCVKNKSERIFAIRNNIGTNFELPYIIVDKVPDTLNDFVALKEQFGWDEGTCDFLLPGLNICKLWPIADLYNWESRNFTEEQANQILDNIERELLKEHPVLPSLTIPYGKKCHSKELNPKNYIDNIVKETHKVILLEQLKSLREYVKTNKGYKSHSYFGLDIDLTSAEQDEYWIHGADGQYFWEKDQNELHHFALGVIDGSQINWFVISTNKSSGSCDKVKYDLGLHIIEIRHLISKDCDIEHAQTITEKEYFGRGQFCLPLQNKKICVVGVGAIGSLVCESLTRSGINVMGLWDDDTVEPGNICRSAFSVPNIGNSKVNAIKEHITSINPFVEINAISTCGEWHSMTGNPSIGPFKFMNGSFYGSVNYSSQKEAIKKLEEYDLIIDCTGSNELLHFLSYAVPEKDVISICITNHASNLLLISSQDGNPFELRKMYLSKIEQDTQNFYVEGSGCYSPTFLATYSDIASLVNLALREINAKMEKQESIHSIIYNYTDRGIVADRLKVYGLNDSPIHMIIPTETLLDGEEMFNTKGEVIGYLLGGYSLDGKMVMVSHIIEADTAKEILSKAFKQSGGIVDYLGDYVYSDANTGSYNPKYLDIMAAKAEDTNININNPILAIRNTDGSLSFYLYLAGKLEQLLPVK